MNCGWVITVRPLNVRHQSPLRARVAVDVALGGFDRTMPREQLHVAQATAGTVDVAGPVIRSYRGSHLKANSIVNWFVALFKELGYEGCSSHSGRRSFIMMAARRLRGRGRGRLTAHLPRFLTSL